MENQACKISRWQLLKAKLEHVKSQDLPRFLKENDDRLLLDVRTLGEFESGHLPDALHMDFLGEHFWDQFEKLDREKPYLVYCRSGRRSARVSLWMQNAGFGKVLNLEDGLKGAPEEVELVVTV